jgi:hypothetical protein
LIPDEGGDSEDEEEGAADAVSPMMLESALASSFCRLLAGPGDDDEAVEAEARVAPAFATAGFAGAKKLLIDIIRAAAKRSWSFRQRIRLM